MSRLSIRNLTNHRMNLPGRSLETTTPLRMRLNGPCGRLLFLRITMRSVEQQMCPWTPNMEPLVRFLLRKSFGTTLHSHCGTPRRESCVSSIKGIRSLPMKVMQAAGAFIGLVDTFLRMNVFTDCLFSITLVRYRRISTLFHKAFRRFQPACSSSNEFLPVNVHFVRSCSKWSPTRCSCSDYSLFRSG
jgi:hypothetical protein